MYSRSVCSQHVCKIGKKGLSCIISWHFSILRVPNTHTPSHTKTCAGPKPVGHHFSCAPCCFSVFLGAVIASTLPNMIWWNGAPFQHIVCGAPETIRGPPRRYDGMKSYSIISLPTPYSVKVLCHVQTSKPYWVKLLGRQSDTILRHAALLKAFAYIHGDGEWFASAS